MKKYLFLLVVPLLFFSVGCEEDDTQLDSDLFGQWSCTIPDFYNDSNPLPYTFINLTLSSNANFVWEVVGYTSLYNGAWWIEENYVLEEDFLFLSGTDGFERSGPYIVLGDTLEYDFNTWTQQD